MLRLTPGFNAGRKERIYSRQTLPHISGSNVWFWFHSWLGFLILSHVGAPAVLLRVEILAVYTRRGWRSRVRWSSLEWLPVFTAAAVAQRPHSAKKCSTTASWCTGDKEGRERRALMVRRRRLLLLRRVSSHLHPSQTFAGQQTSNAARPPKRKMRKQTCKRVNNSRKCLFLILKTQQMEHWHFLQAFKATQKSQIFFSFQLGGSDESGVRR